MADEKLTTVVSVRFTEQETVQLRARASGRPVSHLVRELTVKALHGITVGAPFSGHPLRQPPNTVGNTQVVFSSTLMASTTRSAVVSPASRQPANS